MNSTPAITKRALLIQQDLAHADSINFMGGLIASFGYALFMMYPPYNSGRHVVPAVLRLAELARPCDMTVIYYSGHGNGVGLAYYDVEENNGKDDSHLRTKPEDLITAAAQIKGKKAIIIDTCHSGMFVDYVREHPGCIDNYVVLAACPGDKDTIKSNNDLTSNKPIGSLAWGIDSALRENHSLPDLSTLAITCGTPGTRSMIERLQADPLYDGDKKDVCLDPQRHSDTNFIL